MVQSIDPTLGIPALQAYWAAGIILDAGADADSQITLATVARCAVVMCWDCRAITKHRQVPRYNAVNHALGYPSLALHLPPAILHYDDEHGVPSDAIQMKRRMAELRAGQG